MKIEYIYVITGIKSGNLKVHDANIKELRDTGYLDEKNNLTDKANGLITSLEACSEIYENSYEFRKDATKVVNDVKETFDGIFNSFRNNTSGLLQTMAEKIKVK